MNQAEDAKNLILCLESSVKKDLEYYDMKGGNRDEGMP